MSPFRFGTPKSSTVNCRDEEETSTLAGGPSPTRHSKLPKAPHLGETPVLAPQQLEKSNTSFPVLSVSIPTPDNKAISEGGIQAVTRRVSNLALSPPLSAPANPLSRPSSGSSQAPSTIPTPFSQPQIPIPIPAPPLSITHYECYQDHKKMFKLSNRHYAVPCMVCKVHSIEDHWKCVWCFLWICATCVESLRQIEDHSLRVLVERVVKKKENNRKAMGGKGEGIKSEKAGEGSSFGFLIFFSFLSFKRFRDLFAQQRSPRGLRTYT